MQTSIANGRIALRRSLPAARREAPPGRNEDDRQLSALMRSAQDGDRIAYASLLQKVLPLLKRAVAARLRFLTPMDREDVVQDILLSLHAARATYDPQRPFTPWLMTIAHNRMVDQARRNGRRSAHETLVDEYPEIMTGTEASAGTESAGDPEELQRAIKALPRGQRSAIELLKLREMSLKEASQATGMSVGALKVSVHRAIRTLRTALRA